MQGWIERIASIYRLNEARLAHYDPVIKRQTPAFDAAQGALKAALDGLFAEAARELVGLPDQARQGRALRSLLNHREGRACSSTARRCLWITIAPKDFYGVRP